jgi:hypothetical protein
MIPASKNLFCFRCANPFIFQKYYSTSAKRQLSFDLPGENIACDPFMPTRVTPLK